MTAAIIEFVPMADLPNRIREMRKLPRPGHPRGWTLQQLAEKVNSGISQISDLELGKRELTYHWMQRLAAAMGCAAGDFLLADDNPGSLDPAERALIERYRAATPDQREQLSRMADVIVPWTGPAGEADADAA